METLEFDLDGDMDDFMQKLETAIDNNANTDNRNDRERPYLGQPHTYQGERGKQLVEGLTMRDIADCIVQGMLRSSGTDLCNKVFETDKEFMGTPYASKGDWKYKDVYDLPDDIDPIAVVQNTICMIEHYMGIFPNVPKLKDNDNSY